MESIIERLKDIQDEIDTIIFGLEGGFPEAHVQDSTIEKWLRSYTETTIGNLETVIKDLLRNHGAKQMTHRRDNINSNNK